MTPCEWVATGLFICSKPMLGRKNVCEKCGATYKGPKPVCMDCYLKPMKEAERE